MSHDTDFLPVVRAAHLEELREERRWLVESLWARSGVGIIGGAPKCGTSTLFTWLAAHPDVCGSTPKETFFLMDEGHPLLNRVNVHASGLGAYGSFFKEKPGAAHRLEGTTQYLYQTTPLSALVELEQPPHVVFVVRRPGARVYSSFRYTANNLARLRRPLEFVDYVRLAKERRELRVVADQRGNPTYAPHLAEAILAMAAMIGDGRPPPWGIYHAAGTGQTSWHEFAVAIVDAARPLGVHAVASMRPRRREPFADLRALDRVDAHAGCSKVGVELAVNRRAPAGRDAGRHAFDDRAEAVFAARDERV